MNLEHSTPELFTALAKMQGEVENATKGSVNPHFKSRYADLAEVLNTVRPVLAANGLSVVQSPSFEDGACHVTTTIAHSSGGYISGKMSCIPAKQDAQGIGAATTYLRRYSLAAVCGVAQEDDDGNTAAHNKPAVTYPLITSAEAARIKENVEFLGIDEAAFLKHYGVKSIGQLTTDKIPAIDRAFAAKSAQVNRNIENQTNA
jgi:hypothetical protein